MADQYLSMDNLKFLLHEVHQVSDLLNYPHYADFDEEGIDLMLDSAKDLADQELFPYITAMDEQPVRFDQGKIITHPQLRKFVEKSAENGWIRAEFEHEHGGLQLPSMVKASAEHIFYSANNHAQGYVGLTAGAADLIATFANQELIDTYLPNMLDGKWLGTMALTEPQAGSSLSDLTTSATPAEDGHYLIKGQKIFISGGDNDFSENIIHLMLARIDGAPAGTKGISLFVVPKMRIEEDGSLTPNDVTTAGDFEKMGQRGYCTTHLVMGDHNDCRGWLVGEAHKGLKYMFQMMNGARIGVGITATSIASAAYYASLQYAKERPQGRKLTRDGKKDMSQEPTLIINHPDVRRMLFLQKAIIEGSLSLLLECSKLADQSTHTEGDESEAYLDLLEILTPVAKTYPSEKGQVAISNGLQVLGGYGFCMDFPLQLYYRDVRISAIYEGTTGIQSLDLLGRKATMKNGKALQLLLKAISSTMEEAMAYDELQPYCKALQEQLGLMQKVLGHLMPFAMQGDYERFLADATIFMEMACNIIIGWQWLKQGVVAKQALLGAGNARFTPEFYQQKLHTMKFFFKYELPRCTGHAQILLDPAVLTIGREEELIG